MNEVKIKAVASVDASNRDLKQLASLSAYDVTLRRLDLSKNKLVCPAVETLTSISTCPTTHKLSFRKPSLTLLA